jgi:sec-independent protein translocase protein TatA
MVGDILQPTHLVFVLLVALLVLGPKRLPEVGRQLGNGLRDFRAAINGEHSEPAAVQAPYEEPASDTPAEHEFAHATSDSTLGEFKPDHEASEDSASGHEFAHEPETATGTEDAQNGAEPDSGHEFAYETSEPSDKRTDPLA